MVTGNCGPLIQTVSYYEIMKLNELGGDWMPRSVQSVRCSLHVQQSILSKRAVHASHLHKVQTVS
jgi:hypothetical protein